MDNVKKDMKCFDQFQQDVDVWNNRKKEIKG